MYLSAITQESLRGWCQTLMALAAAWPIIVATVKLVKAKIETESTKRSAMNSLISIAPALVEIAHQFNSLKTEVAENTAITKEILRNQRGNKAGTDVTAGLVERIAEQSQQQHDKNP